MGFVLQDLFFFQGIIRENICYGCLDVFDLEVEEVVKVVNVYGFIEWFFKGYDIVFI